MKSRLNKLDPYAEQLREWDAQNLPIESTIPGRDSMLNRLAALGCESSQRGIGRYLEHLREESFQERLLGQIASGAETCKVVEAQFNQTEAPGLETLVKLHRVLIMQLAMKADTDPELIRLASGAMKPVLDYAKLELKHKEFGLEQEKFALLKARAAKADQAEQVANSDLTPEEKQRKMREIFGLV